MANSGRFRAGAIRIAHALNAFASARFGLALARTRNLYPWQLRPSATGARSSEPLPPGAEDYLRPDNPRLLELTERYARMDKVVTMPLVWLDDILGPNELLYFRGDNAYVWQRRGLNQSELAYVLTYYYTKSAPEGRYLSAIQEDSFFGLNAFTIDGRQVSRDLLDSAREMEFLTRHVQPKGEALNIIDIGAGYGRLAYRMHEALGPKVKIFASDAFPASTFLSEYYLRYRGCSRATVVPLDEVDQCLSREAIDVAVNIHSFSECTPGAIRWWVSRLARAKVSYLIVMPNGQASDGGHRCLTNDGHDMADIFAESGYRFRASEPRYLDPLVQQFGVDPAVLHLFALD